MRYIYFIFFINSWTLYSFGDSFTPAYYPSPRAFGVNQLATISCIADSSIHVIEQSLALNGSLNSRVSRNHFVFNWAVNNWATFNRKDFDKLVKFTSKSHQIQQKYGPLVPEFFNPEDGELVDESSTGDKFPPLESTGIYLDLGFSSDALNFKPDEAVYQGMSWESLLDTLKAKIRIKSIGISIHDKILYNINKGQISFDNSIFNSSTTHRVAIVGYDDQKRAFLIKNSWNSQRATQEGLGRPSLWIGNSNAGYYWLPYRYVASLYQHESALYTITFSFNVSAFDNYYNRAKANMQVGLAPYICDSRNELRFFLDGLRTRLLDKDRNNMSLDWQDHVRAFMRLLMHDPSLKPNEVISGPIIYFAKIPLRYRSKVNDYRRFYNGDRDLKNYYCKRGNLFPDINSPEDSWFFDNDVLNALSRLSDEGNRYDAQVWEDVFRTVVRKWVINGKMK